MSQRCVKVALKKHTAFLVNESEHFHHHLQCMLLLLFKFNGNQSRETIVANFFNIFFSSKNHNTNRVYLICVL